VGSVGSARKQAVFAFIAAQKRVLPGLFSFSPRYPGFPAGAHFGGSIVVATPFLQFWADLTNTSKTLILQALQSEKMIANAPPRLPSEGSALSS
jgi:hypothetical protein